MRHILLLGLLVSCAAYGQTATTNCYTIDGTYLSCRTQSIETPVRFAPGPSIDPAVVSQLIERIVQLETRAMSDAWVRVLERASKMDESQLKASVLEGTPEQQTIRETEKWLGYSPSRLAVERWRQQKR